ncbi:restriction endonuclease subunit S [Algoriphagus faecimaris]|uniref:restriction endonuclease subunit S n=1 Tax=Algoriphagus faecimaris TaxID=686796 RepID=UPI00146BA7E7|nr:restriction endonuclease subunit S [Algoriphagus faecimaris]
MKIQLKKIANIRSGVFFKPYSQGDVMYLQAKDFDKNGKLSSPLFPALKWTDVSEKHLLNSGDVVFAAKGWKNFASVYDNSGLPAVASTSFLVISLVVDYIEPRFLAWWLNSMEIQEFLKGIAKGTSLPSITKAQMEQLEVLILPKKIQEKLIKVYDLSIQEKELQHQIAQLRSQKLEFEIKKALTRYE